MKTALAVLLALTPVSAFASEYQQGYSASRTCFKTEYREEYLQKVANRVKSYEVKILNEPREGKKLLVLDIDYTLFDHKSTAETGRELMRPYLHEFLTTAYEVISEIFIHFYDN